VNESDSGQVLRRAIEDLQADVRRQIQSYPPPIPACDAQFNHLLELRRRLPAELDRLEAVSAAGGLNIADFLEKSPIGADLAPFLAGTKS
jgi:hypothetical protein